MAERPVAVPTVWRVVAVGDSEILDRAAASLQQELDRGLDAGAAGLGTGAETPVTGIVLAGELMDLRLNAGRFGVPLQSLSGNGVAGELFVIRIAPADGAMAVLVAAQSAASAARGLAAVRDLLLDSEPLMLGMEWTGEPTFARRVLAVRVDDATDLSLLPGVEVLRVAFQSGYNTAVLHLAEVGSIRDASPGIAAFVRAARGEGLRPGVGVDVARLEALSLEDWRRWLVAVPDLGVLELHGSPEESAEYRSVLGPLTEAAFEAGIELWSVLAEMPATPPGGVAVVRVPLAPGGDALESLLSELAGHPFLADAVIAFDEARERIVPELPAAVALSRRMARCAEAGMGGVRWEWDAASGGQAHKADLVLAGLLSWSPHRLADEILLQYGVEFLGLSPEDAARYARLCVEAEMALGCLLTPSGEPFALHGLFPEFGERPRFADLLADNEERVRALDRLRNGAESFQQLALQAEALETRLHPGDAELLAERFRGLEALARGLERYLELIRAAQVLDADFSPLAAEAFLGEVEAFKNASDALRARFGPDVYGGLPQRMNRAIGQAMQHLNARKPA